MTVKELIEELSKLPPDAEVRVYTEADGKGEGNYCDVYGPYFNEPYGFVVLGSTA